MRRSSAAIAASAPWSASATSSAGWRPVVLDHIDGDSSNNRRENLRLVCPNCDSQLETYKARNRGKGRAWRRQRYAEGKSY
ncbi:endonuclease [Nocardioides ganghwensis]|uniref:Endonuclease n=1 Tax=Nocardioides ganghwensis TaxID=252230 RepID=A0A4Q2SJU3_9ACTN|nr:endonuclease [Nocardioides ganghwensis]